MFHDNSEVEEHEVMLINADPIQKSKPFARYPTHDKNIQIIVDLILRNKKLEKFVGTCTCQNEERSKLMSSVGSKKDRIAARLRSTLRMDLEIMNLLGDLESPKKVSLAKSRPGSDIMNAAGFKNSIFITPFESETKFAHGYVYVGVVDRGKQKIRALMGILNAGSVEVMLADDMEINQLMWQNSALS
eukprot:UN01910